MVEQDKVARTGALRITTVRMAAQAFFFAAFAALLLCNTFTFIAAKPRATEWLSKFLEIDPLIALSTAITTHTVYKGLMWSLVLIIPTLLLGRIFCNWICPFGTLHHFAGWLLGRRSVAEQIDVNRHHRGHAAKYYILAAMLLAAAFGSLQIGLLDPICLIYRSFTVSVIPPLNMPTQQWFGDYRLHQMAWIVGFVLIFFVAMNIVWPRFFCRMLCPLGALLGILSRFGLWRIERDEDKCTACDLCLANCEGACDPHTKLRKAECTVCFNCIEACPHDALRFEFLPARSGEVTNPDLSRRKVVFAGVLGTLFFPLARATGRSTVNFAGRAVRPPGAVEEIEFLKRCVKCGQCIRVCPTNVLQPAMLEAGIEGMWTPTMNFRIGFCQLNCTACAQVCPTGAIQRIGVEEKLGVGRCAGEAPIRIGTAHFDLGRCLPWSKNTPCVVCEEVCPTSPKAIYSEWQKMLIRDGKKLIVSAGSDTVTVAEFPSAGQTRAKRTVLRPDELVGDESRRYHLKVLHADGTEQTHRIVANTVDVVQIAERFSRLAKRGDIAAIMIELKVPKIDISMCIGCGLCEHECPVVSDQRAVYVTAEGETRSQDCSDPKRNRSIRLIKSEPSA